MKTYPHKTSTMAAGVVGMRIVLGYLLLLSIMIVGINAAKPDAPVSVEVTDIDGNSASIKCTRPASNDCSKDTDFTDDPATSNCKYQFWYGATFGGAKQVAEQLVDKYIPMRNGLYWCRLVHKVNGDGTEKEADKKVDKLTEMPSIGAAPAAPVCGKDLKVTLTCTRGTPVSPNKVTLQMRIVRADKHEEKTWTNLNDSKVTHEIDTPAVETKYNCEARATSAPAQAFPSVSDVPVTVPVCAACNDGGAAEVKCPDGFKCDTDASPATCKSDTPTSAPPNPDPSKTVNPAHTTGGSGGGGSTGSGGSGTTSGASDLGRPASLLTIVCSLLTLTLALRG